jgi:hypothetical protein
MADTPPSGMSKEDAKRIAEELAKLTKSGTGPLPATPSADKTKAFDSAIDKVSGSLTGGFEKGLGAATAAYTKLKDTIVSNMGMWQDLTKSGMNFSGDLVGMTIAAKGMRLETKEMSEILQKNSEGLVGFGGNLTRSAEEFAKASKHFFDNNTEAADGLRRLGMTSKEINEVMVLQGPMMRGQFRDEQERMQVMADSTNKMAQEMDLMAKLTGKSREQQLEAMKKQQADMQFDAAIREKAKQIDDPVKRAAFVKQANEELRKAEAEGRGQLYKELFAFGAPLTKATATQAVMYGESTAALKKSVDALNDTQLSGADREKKLQQAREDIAVADMKAANDSTLNRLRMLSDVTEVGQVLNKQAGATNTVTRNLETFAAKYNENEKNKVKLDLDNEADRRKAYQLMVEDAKAARAGQNAQGEQVDGTTKALTSLEGRLGDVSSALYDKLAKPLNKEVSEALGKLADSALSARGAFFDIAGPNTKNQTIPNLIAEQAEIGRTTKTPQNIIQGAGAVGRTAEQAVNAVSNQGPGFIDKAKEKFDQITGRTAKPEKRMTGSLGATGSMFENFGTGQLMELHGTESVMTPKDLNAIVKNTMEGAMKAVPKTGIMDYEQLAKMADSQRSTTSMSKLDEQKRAAIMAGSPKTGNLDLKKMSDTISTNVSSSYGDKVDMRSLKFDQYGMPITSQIKAKTAEMSAEVKKKEEEKAASASAPTPTPAAAPASTAPKPEEKKPEVVKSSTTGGKDSTLNDVVTALNQLNSKVSSLIEVQKDLGQRQIKATKANGKDVYAS